MTRLAAIASLVLALTWAFAGCGGCADDSSGHECETLTDRLCAGKDPAYCDRVAAWLRGRLTGPDGAELAQKHADRGCRMILEDDNLLRAYAGKATEDLDSAPPGASVPE